MTPKSCADRKIGVCGRADCEDCHFRSFASHKWAQYWSANNVIQPSQISKWTKIAYEFNCPDCPHTIIKSPHQVRVRGCNYCANRELCADPSCGVCSEKSFASNKMSQHWNYSANEMTPRDVFRSSSSKHCFICHICGHKFEAILNNIAAGRWCGYCGSKYLCQTPCDICWHKSFAANPKAIYWSDKNPKAPWQMCANSIEVCIFNCPTCHHEITPSLRNISQSSNWCVYCAGRKLCSDDNCVKILF
jgi:hypothetical protein